MAADRGIVSFFEQATGIDVPDTIAGIPIPDPEISQVAGVASDVFDHLDDFGDLVEKAGKIREVVATARHTAGNCWGTIDLAQDIYDSISQKIEPLSPLFRLGSEQKADDPAEVARAVSVLKDRASQETALEVIGDVLNLGKLLQRLGNVLQGVKAIFQTVMDTCGDIIEAVKEFMSDVAEEFADALGLGGALEGLQELLEGIAGVAAKMLGIGDVLTPIVKELRDALDATSWFDKAKEGAEAAAMMASNFDSMKGAIADFWPAWEESQAHYATARELGQAAEQGSSRTWRTFKQLFCQLCKMLNMEVPGGINALDDKARPTVAPRGGFIEEEEFVER